MSVAVGLGLMEFPFAGVQGYWRWVDLCEAGGVDSLWQTDRLLSREPMLECMTAMAALAGRTRRLKFGMNVVSLAMRDPVLVAKQCATIDVLSEGRLLPAFGIGSPRAPEWAALHLDTQDARPQDRRGAGDRAPPVAGGQRRLRRRALPPVGRDHLAQAGAGRPADVDRRRVGGGDPAHGARRHRLAGRPRDAGGGRARRRRHPRGRCRGRPQHRRRPLRRELPLLFRARRRPGRAARRWRPTPSARARDADGYFAVGDAGAIVERIAEYIAAGISKFVLRPVGAGDEAMLAQTRQLIEQVLPQVAARWPKAGSTAVGR